jgi:hypothetical protein
LKRPDGVLLDGTGQPSEGSVAFRERIDGRKERKFGF